MPKFNNEKFRSLTDLTSKIEMQIKAQHLADGDLSREITIRLPAIDAILAHCSLAVFNGGPQTNEDEDEIDRDTLAPEVFDDNPTTVEVSGEAGVRPVGASEPETAAAADEEEAILPDGIYRMEFDFRTDRDRVAVADFEATVLEGYQAGGKVTERLSFGAVFTNADRAARTKARRFAQIFGLNENESDSGAFLYRPFIAHVVDGEIAEAGIDSLSELPTGQSRIARGHAIHEAHGRRPWGAPTAA